MRIKVIRIFFLLFMVAVVARLFYWQVVKADELSAKAENQYFTDNKIQAKRGDIYFSDSTVLAATTPMFSLFANPKVLSNGDKQSIASQLTEIFKRTEPDFDKNSIVEKLSQDFYWVSLKKNLDYDTKNEIKKLQLPSLGFDQTESRFYPEGSSSAHILGFVASDVKGDKKGYFGVEGYYDGELKGIPGLIKHEKDANGIPILSGHFSGNDPKNGKDLILNIDRTVQFTVEEILKQRIQKYGAKSGSIVVMEPKSGAILAMAAYPNYDPGNYVEFPKEFFKNPIVADSYEPGSTFKVLVMAAGINEDLVEPDTKCDICSAPVQVGEYKIRTWNNQYTDQTTMKDVIIHSDNTGMVFVGRKLGLDKMYDYITNFGFGQSTKIDLQDETFPELRSKKDWHEIDLATSSFGQGIAVTPIQMVSAVASIANGGYLMEPHVVKAIKDENGIVDIKPRVVHQVLKPATAQIMKEMMIAAVEQGEAKAFKPKGFKVAGKTGTAQIPVAGHYDADKTIASFVGFAPADDPKFVMLVRFDQPSSSIYGSETAAPTFFDISKELLPYFNVAPSE